MPLQFRSTASRAPTRDARSRPAKARPTNWQPRRNCAILRSFASSLLGPSGRLTAAGDRHLGITRECHERVADTGSGKAFWNGALVELSDGTLRGLGSREETCVASMPKRKRVHPSEATARAADKVFFARGFRNAHPLSHRGSAATWHKSQCSALRPRESELNKSRRPRLGCLEPKRHQPSCGGLADSPAEGDPGRRRTPSARPAPAPDHTAVACPHPRRDAAERGHGKAVGGATKARDRAGLEQASKRRHLAGAPSSLGDVLDRPGRNRRIIRRAAVHDQRGRRASRPAHDYGNERSPEGYVVEVPGDCASGPAEVLACAPNTRIRGHLADTVLHLRLVNGAPFPSRNLGPWMTVFSRPNRGG